MNMWIYLKVFYLAILKVMKCKGFKKFPGAFFYKEVIRLGLTLHPLSLWNNFQPFFLQVRPLSFAETGNMTDFFFLLQSVWGTFALLTSESPFNPTVLSHRKCFKKVLADKMCLVSRGVGGVYYSHVKSETRELLGTQSGLCFRIIRHIFLIQRRWLGLIGLWGGRRRGATGGWPWGGPSFVQPLGGGSCDRETQC